MMLRRRAALVVALGALLLASCDVGQSPSTPTQQPTHVLPLSSPTPGEHSTAFIKTELDYIDNMIPHHQLAIDMSKIALDKAQHGEIQGIAHDIITEQNDEIHRLQVWRG